MGRGFSNKTKISKHNVSFSIHPDKSIIKSMNWKEGESVEVIPLPSKGVICLKGKKISNNEFAKRFYLESIKNNNKKRIEKILKRFKSLQKKFDPLDIIAYQEAFQGILNLEKQLEKIINNWEKFLIQGEKNIRKKFDIPVGKYS